MEGALKNEDKVRSVHDVKLNCLARDTINAIALDNIDESNERLVGFPEDQEDELVYEEGDLTWGTVATTIGANENIYGLRGISSSSRALDKGKVVQTTFTSSSRTWTVIDEESEEGENEEQYNEMDAEFQDFENLEEE
ncbi:hypothetical protein MTR67_031214 [Solanum verrucosum]|uniref:Uncharacterized protein n=1 Tax=Solanum verrucosum TaxID=315347 RepID=A0AAF0U230_SOLVR|nr:hypothetical protein MTR67_031214 [Solanum verrucosum]